jgi:hypothetical protein
MFPTISGEDILSGKLDNQDQGGCYEQKTLQLHHFSSWFLKL